jgi:hypothetical protein
MCMSLIGGGHVLGEARDLREQVVLKILSIDRHQRGDRLAVSCDEGGVLGLGDGSDDATCVAAANVRVARSNSMKTVMSRTVPTDQMALPLPSRARLPCPQRTLDRGLQHSLAGQARLPSVAPGVPTQCAGGRLDGRSQTLDALG